MLAETLAWLLTPASVTARRLGLLAESIAIAARHRRCRAAWAPHLEASRQALLASARSAPGHRTALLLGTGHLLDIPLTELAHLFDEVWLVDVVHPWSSRLQAWRHGNVTLIAHDVTEHLSRIGYDPAMPRRFLDQPEIDWVASVNLLSQLARPAQQALHARRPDLDEAALARYCAALMARHLEWLGLFKAPVCLLADLEQTHQDALGNRVEHTDLQPLLSRWEIAAEWRWDIAPPGELGGGQHAHHRVAALRRRGQHEDQNDVADAQ